MPRTEAPIRDLRSPSGWHIVASAFLPHDEEDPDATLRVRFFGRDGKLRATEEAMIALQGVGVGYLFGGPADIFALQSNVEHSYNSTTSLWLLPVQGGPQQLIGSNATLGKFSKGENGTRPGTRHVNVHI